MFPCIKLCSIYHEARAYSTYSGWILVLSLVF
jgi:hypothetical protein